MFRRPPEPVKAPVKYLYGRALTAVMQKVHAGYSPDRTILLIGSPRSGSTLVQEILTELPGAAAIFEPLNPLVDPVLSDFHRDEWVRLARTDAHPELEEYLREVLAGRHWTRWSAAHAGVRRLLPARRFVAKFIRATRATGWLAERFPANPKLLVLRHPGAIVSSMMRSRSIWNHWHPREVLDRIAGQLGPEIRPTLDRIRRREGLLAAFCCADLSLALRETAPDEIHLVVYEQLVRDPEPELEAMFRALGEAVVPEGARAAVGRPSRTSNTDSPLRTGGDPVTHWRNELDPQALDEIAMVLDGFGLDFYTPEGSPDLEALARFPRARAGA